MEISLGVKNRLFTTLKNNSVLQGILDNPSPFRRREKVTDLKGDGLPNK
jgi:hypothetical protein